jgi:hypothetical protein
VRTISFLILVLLFADPLIAYTVVLKSGKRIEGTFVAEDQATLQIKDSRGVILSFKRERLDLDFMVRLNAGSESDPPKATEDTFVARTRSREIDLAAFADQTQKDRKGNARTVTAADLDSAPELTILGTEDDPKPEGIEAVSNRDEQQWRKEAVSLRKEISRLREKRIVSETSCQAAEQRLSEKRTRPSRQPAPLLSSFQKPPECLRLAEIDRQIEEAQMRLENFEERARRAEIPWQWIE